MTSRSSQLARSLTWAASKQSYITAGLMVDRKLVDDAFRAYGYFRWVDDFIDVEARSKEDRTSFAARQKEIIEALYGGDRPADLTPEEEIIADLICKHRENGPGLRSYISKMMAILVFDANRRGSLISGEELKWYSEALGTSVIDAITFFVGNDRSYPRTDRYAAGIAAHIAHMLRDMRDDISDGFVNIPREFLQQHELGPEDVAHPAYRSWVRERVDRARQLFDIGKRYLDRLSLLRVKVVGYWYCARFDKVLEAIESDQYVLRKDYGSRHGITNWLRMASVATATTFRHVWPRKPLEPPQRTTDHIEDSQ